MKIVTASIMIDDDKVLIAKRKKFGNLEFPGGKIEPGETPEACLKREIQEELGFEIKVEHFFCESIYSYPNGCIKLLAYLTTWVSGDLFPTEHEEIKWVTLDKLNEYDFLPADMPIVEKLRSEGFAI